MSPSKKSRQGLLYMSTVLICRGEMLTIDDGNISVLVELRESDRGPRDGGHVPDSPPVVRAVQVAGSCTRLIASARPYISTLQPASTQAVWEVKGVPCAVPAVRFVNPLHHSWLCGNAGVLAW